MHALIHADMCVRYTSRYTSKFHIVIRADINVDKCVKAPIEIGIDTSAYIHV